MRNLTALSALVVALFLAACSAKSGMPQQTIANEEDNCEAKQLLQGIWVDDETQEVSFRAIGDTIFYPDSVSQPTCFKIISDSLVLDAVNAKYPIIKQSANVFWFKNQNGDIIKLSKNDDPALIFSFVRNRPHIMTYSKVVKTDSVVYYDGTRYHWYIAINPTKYKVHATSYNDDGVEVDNVYYDNIMHVSVFQGVTKLFSSDFRKQLYASKIPEVFLNQAVLSNMEYTGIDAAGLHFVATICIPSGASCYKAENIIAFDGKQTSKLIEY